MWNRFLFSSPVSFAGHLYWITSMRVVSAFFFGGGVALVTLYLLTYVWFLGWEALYCHALSVWCIYIIVFRVNGYSVWCYCLESCLWLYCLPVVPGCNIVISMSLRSALLVVLKFHVPTIISMGPEMVLSSAVSKCVRLHQVIPHWWALSTGCFLFGEGGGDFLWSQIPVQVIGKRQKFIFCDF